MQSQKSELIRRLQARDEMLQQVTSEATKLKEKLKLASGRVCNLSFNVIQFLIFTDIAKK